MSGYIELNRTGFAPFDDALSLIEEAGTSYHHTSQWLDDGWNGEKPYIDRINESIEFAANSYSDLIDALTALKTELREICAAIDDPASDLTLTAVECIKKLKAGNEWQPIETAPKDGTRILGWCAEFGARETKMNFYGEGSIGHANWKSGKGPRESGWDWTEPKNGWGLNWNPTHWMPLPKPPAMAQGEK